MALKISGQTVVDDSRKGTFKLLQPGQFTVGNEPTNAVPGDIIWETTNKELRVYNGVTWDSV